MLICADDTLVEVATDGHKIWGFRTGVGQHVDAPDWLIAAVNAWLSTPAGQKAVQRAIDDAMEC